MPEYNCAEVSASFEYWICTSSFLVACARGTVKRAAFSKCCWNFGLERSTAIGSVGLHLLKALLLVCPVVIRVGQDMATMVRRSLHHLTWTGNLQCRYQFKFTSQSEGMLTLALPEPELS